MELHKRRKAITEPEARYFCRQVGNLNFQNFPPFLQFEISNISKAGRGLRLPARDEGDSPRLEVGEPLFERRNDVENRRFRARHQIGL